MTTKSNKQSKSETKYPTKKTNNPSKRKNYPTRKKNKQSIPNVKELSHSETNNPTADTKCSQPSRGAGGKKEEEMERRNGKRDKRKAK